MKKILLAAIFAAGCTSALWADNAKIMQIMNAELDGQVYKTGTPIWLHADVYNLYDEDVTDAVLVYRIDDAEATNIEIGEVGADIQKTFMTQIPTDEVTDGVHTLYLWTCTQTPTAEELAGMRPLKIQVGTYSTSYPKVCLLEEFTTIKCVGCPFGAKNLEAFAEGRDDVAIIAHHVGYYTDEFTLNASTTIQNAMDIHSAPSLICDRHDRISIGHTYLSTGKRVITEYVEPFLAEPAFAKVSTTNSYDPDTRILTVTVSAERHPVLSMIAPTNNLSIFVTESQIKSIVPQTGAEHDEDYRHAHVLRTFDTIITGTAIEWDSDNKYEKTVELPIAEEWHPENMDVVAAINPPLTSMYDRYVLNACTQPVDYTLSLEQVDEQGLGLRMDKGSVVAGGLPVEVYTMQGVRVANRDLQGGLYIVRVLGAQGQSRTYKVAL